MPFHMTHLHIAKNLYHILPGKISDLPRFYLGNLAPDAVHNRKNYNPDYKRMSHLCVGNEPWGMTVDNDSWTENVLEFLRSNINSGNRDFLLGYCCHVLSDIYNNLTIWMPFRFNYPEEFAKGYGGLYHAECDKVDIELGLRKENRDDFWIFLEKAEPVDFNNLVFAEELGKHKENILYKRYVNREHPDLSSNKIITIERTMKFIEDAARFVAGKITCIV